MPAHAVPIDVKEKGVMWLLPPYRGCKREAAKILRPTIFSGLYQDESAYPDVADGALTWQLTSPSSFMSLPVSQRPI